MPVPLAIAASLWQHLVQALSPGHLPWTILWVGLATLIIGLIVLTRTSWGHSNPLHKCVAMSLLAHLLLAAYATTVQIVTAGSPDGNSDRGAVTITLAGDPAEGSEQTPDEPQKPWDKLLLDGPVVAPNVLPIAAMNMAPLSVPAPSELKPQNPPEVKATADLTPAAPPPLKPADLSPSASPSSVEKPPPSPASIAAQPTKQPAEDTTPAAADSATKPEASDVKPVSSVTPGAAELPIAGASKIDPTIKTSPVEAAKIADAAPAPSATTGGETRLVPVTVASVKTHPPDAAGAPSSTAAKSTGAATASTAAPEPEIYKDRTDANRLGILKKYGGTPDTEAAVQAALKWLAQHQSADGHWDAEQFGGGRETSVLGHDRRGAGAKAHTGVTGLALLALMASGNTHLSGPYAENVRRGLNYLITVQGTDGNLGGPAELFSFMYCHGMATFAMSEAYAMTHDSRLEAPLKAAIGYTTAAQHAVTGGWRYQPGDTGDTSQLGWQLMSLKSAELAGIKMKDTTRAGVVRFLGTVSSGRSGGLASYRAQEAPSRTMTAEALVCRQFLGMARDNPAAAEAGDALLAELPSKDHVNLYYWYYGTVGMFQLQGDYWDKWNAALQPALLSQQVTSGADAGSFPPNCIWGGYGGRVYSTAMSALCLEVYYRYLPLYSADPSKRD